jgi:23S rRNA pseudouridine1911/1915/1917 synthase
MFIKAKLEKTHSSNKKFKRFTYIVSLEAEGQRIDKYLGSLPEILTRSRAVVLIESGLVWLNEKPNPKPSHILKINDQVTFEVPQETDESELQPLDIDLDIYYEDEFLIVLNKPAGLVVHPAAGHAQDTLVNALVHHTDDLSMKFGENRPGIVHRLDKDTSGLMVIAKQDAIHEALTLQFRNRTIHRYYQAIVIGSLPKKTGRVQSYLARHPSDRKRYASVVGKDHKIIREQSDFVSIGKWAVTDFEVLSQNQIGLSFVQLKLHTGRTHQIRIHLAEMGHPIVADTLYGQRKFSSLRGELKDTISLFPRLALHAVQLGFEHPKSKENLKFMAPWPQDLGPILEKLNFQIDKG